MYARLGVSIVVLCATVVLPGRTALAQEDDGRWHTSLTPYAWFASLSGRVGFADGIANVDLGVGDVLDKLDISIRALLETRRAPWVARLDATFVAMSDERALEEGSESSVIVELEQTILQPELGYTVLQAPWGGIDVLAGGRYWHPKIDVSADAATGSVDVASGSRSWFDVTGGVLLRFQPAEKWHLVAKGDAGAGGSKLTWQALGSVGFDVSTCCSLVGQYRHLDIDYDRDALVNDSYMSGFALGFEIRF
jgi:hypothetical protein